MYLYKYVSPDRVDILRNRRIRITQPGALNDPFELRPLFHDLVSRSTMTGMLDGHTIDVVGMLREQLKGMTSEQRGGKSIDQVIDTILPQLTPEVLGEGFGMALGIADDLQRSAVEAVRIKLHEIFGKEVGIISLSEIVDNPPMWAHYAANHTGFAICFDSHHRFFNSRRSESDEFFHLRKVVYREAIVFSDFIGMSGDDVMVTKRREWEHEREWRMLVPTRYAATQVGPENDPCYLVEVPREAITEVILGAKCSAVTEHDVRDALASDQWQHVGLRRMVVASDGRLVAK